MTDPALHPYCVSHLPTMASNDGESSFNDENSIYTFEGMRRKLTGLQQNYKNVMQGIGIPFRRKNSNNYRGLNEDVQSSHALLYGENIEMDQLQHLELAERLGQGHDFLPQQLTNPTWCDKCGDFIWGVYKQCLKCKCKYMQLFYQIYLLDFSGFKSLCIHKCWFQEKLERKQNLELRIEKTAKCWIALLIIDNIDITK